MNLEKKTRELDGYLLTPIEIGASAFIKVSDGMLRTSRVLRLQTLTQSEVQFETQNTNYRLHLAKEVPV